MTKGDPVARSLKPFSSGGGGIGLPHVAQLCLFAQQIDTHNAPCPWLHTSCCMCSSLCSALLDEQKSQEGSFECFMSGKMFNLSAPVSSENHIFTIWFQQPRQQRLDKQVLENNPRRSASCQSTKLDHKCHSRRPSNSPRCCVETILHEAAAHATRWEDTQTC